MIRALIFDCFGVVVADGLEAVTLKQGLTKPEKAKLNRLVDQASRGLLDMDFYRREVANLLGLSLDVYIAQVKDGEVMNRPLLDYIASLKQDYLIGMLSNVSNLDSLSARFRHGELETYFDAVIASGSIGFAKPEAQAYEIAAEKLGVRLTECVMVDDKEEYCGGALRVGMRAIKYNSFEQLKSELDKLLAAV